MEMAFELLQIDRFAVVSVARPLEDRKPSQTLSGSDSEYQFYLEVYLRAGAGRCAHVCTCARNRARREGVAGVMDFLN